MNNFESNEEIELKRQVLALEEKVRPFLSKEALQRYSNIRVAHPDVAIQLLVVIARAIDAGKIKTDIMDAELKELLSRMVPKKREFNIIRK